MDDIWNDAVKKAIEEKGLTVKELAEKLDKSEEIGRASCRERV